MSGFLSPAAAKMSTISIGGDGSGDDLADREVEILALAAARHRRPS